MDKIPATLEDVVASLAPGAVFLLGLAWIYPIPLIQQFAGDGSKVLILLIVAYALGHLLRGAASIVVTSWAEESVLEGTWKDFEGQQAFDKKLMEIHGVTPTSAKGREGLCLGMLPQVMPRREGFLVASSFSSSMVIVSIVLPTVEIVRNGLGRIGIPGVLIALACVVVFFARYRKLRRYSAFEVFNALVPSVLEVGPAHRKAS